MSGKNFHFAEISKGIRPIYSLKAGEWVQEMDIIGCQHNELRGKAEGMEIARLVVTQEKKFYAIFFPNGVDFTGNIR